MVGPMADIKIFNPQTQLIKQTENIFKMPFNLKTTDLYPRRYF
jgi:hypothetical protein